jgi:molybdate transport repressor ModE-like protein
MNLNLSINWQINDVELETSIFALLREIDRVGSLQQACKRINVSYRYAWGLMTKWQHLLGQPLVILERGRGARLSDIGRTLLSAQDTLDSRLSLELANTSTEIKSRLQQLLSSPEQNATRIYASHGIAINTLRELLHRHSGSRLDLHFHGSLESLVALQEKQCDIAGFHIPEGELGGMLSDNYTRLISKKTHQLVYIIKRQQGLLVAHQNPKQIHALSDLCSSSITFINRQAQSGTRLLFDQLLQQEKLDHHQILGYENEEYTHMAVGAMVASGMADAGFGIEAVAHKFNLSFIPMVWEHYCLAIPRQSPHDTTVQEIISILKSEAFTSSLAPIPGYDLSRTGDLVKFDDIFPE